MDSQPEVVYHYTSAETLLKIAKSGKIWATNLRYLNDVSESDHCINALRARLPGFLLQHPSEYDDDLRAALARVTDDFDPPYVASFSAVKDSLPQWRSYCPNGNGVSIGFKMSALRESVLSRKSSLGEQFPVQKSSVQKVEYLGVQDWDFQDRILLQTIVALKKFEEEQDALNLPYDEKTMTSDEFFFTTEISSRSSLVKHSAFETEQEYRLIAPSLMFSDAPVQCRCSRTTVIPYLEVLMPEWGKTMESFRYTDFFIQEIVVGPTPDFGLTAVALETFFWSMKVPVTIYKSSVPFRDL
jgi:hypothetical protein